MRIINVIETSMNGVHGIESFCVFEEQLVDAVAKQAESVFLEKAIEQGALENGFDEESLLDDGYYESNEAEDHYQVAIVWSNSNNE